MNNTTTTNDSWEEPTMFDQNNATIGMFEEEGTEEGGLETTEIIIALGLFLIMIGVGAACEGSIFTKMMKSPKARRAAQVGLACQFLIMPFLAYLMSIIFQHDGYQAYGFILIGCMPGGTTSNIFTLWGQGVMELSVFMTVVSTLAAFAFTPLWLFVYGKAIGLEGSALAMEEIATTFAFLIIPLVLGASLNWFSCTRRIKKKIMNVVSAFAVVVFLTVMVVLAVEYKDAFATGYQIYVPGILFLPIGGALSYGLCSLFKLEPALKRTVAIEVSMQNTSLAFAIGQATISSRADRELAIAFPFIYTIFIYVWAAILLPLFRLQKRRNDKLGIVDNDPEFVATEADDSKPSDNQDTSNPDLSNEEASENGGSPETGAEDTV